MKRLLPVLAAVVTAAAPAADDGSPRLPHEGSRAWPALRETTFPDRLSAFVWRNWFCVDKARLAETVGTGPEELTAVAVEMGLPADPKVEPEWASKGYGTILRRNWHLLPYGQILTLLGWSREKLNYYLLEDDYLLQKLGNLKPFCEPLRWAADAVARSRAARRALAEILREEGVDAAAPCEPRFSFVRDLSAAPQPSEQTPAPSGGESPFATRLMFSYFADYADPLMDDAVGSFPEGLLARYAAQGVNAVWVHVVLRTLAKDPFFVEFGVGSERRQANLRTLVARAAKYGIRVFLYLNEPRPMPCAFFERSDAYRACRGTLEWRGLTNAMCTQAPEVRRWMGDAVEKVFRAAPGLGGVFVINASENLVTCVSHGDRSVYEKDPTGACRPERFCQTCQRLSVPEILADDAKLLIDGMHRADPAAKAFVWDWGWDVFSTYGETGLVREVAARLPKANVSLLTMSVRGKPLDIDGTACAVDEYTLSQVGPSEAAEAKWRIAAANGLGRVAKAQVSSSWEMSVVPYVPVMDNVAAHAWNLMRAGVDGVMLSWSCGCYPAPNLRVFDGVRKGDTGPADVLRRVSEELYGTEAAPLARQAWTTLSRAFAQYPFHNATLHRAPHHWGPANPLYPVRTGYRATMVGIPYDDLDGWRSIFPAETYIRRCQAVADGFAAGVRIWEGVVAATRGAAHALSRRELGIIRTVACHMASCADQARFVRARERGDGAEMKAVARRERMRAKELLPIVEADSRLGYECSCHYFYLPQDLREKILNCRQIERDLQD